MISETTPKLQWMRVGLGVLVVFLGLCTIFASVVTAAEAWYEHSQQRWPEVTAHIDSCDLDRASSGRREAFHIRCRLSFEVGVQQNVANIYSINVPSPEIWQYPPNQIEPFAEWVNQHPPGTPIIVRYDPANHSKAVLVANYMPRGGPRTPSNLKLLEVCAASFLVLLTTALVTRPRSLSKRGSPAANH